MINRTNEYRVSVFIDRTALFCLSNILSQWMSDPMLTDHTKDDYERTHDRLSAVRIG